MPSMKPWEREIIEYRPNIGLDTHILSVVQSGEHTVKFKPSAVVTKATTVLGIDVIENVIASLSRGVHLLSQLEKSLAGDTTFEAYKKAEDLITAREIFVDHLADINGNADFDVYPILSDAVREMEEYIDYLNKELFDHEADLSDLIPVREKEEQQIIGLLDIESEDLRTIQKEDLTKEQLALIDRMIKDKTHPLSSLDEYIEHINEEIRNDGSSRIDYGSLINRIQFIAAANEKSNLYKNLMDHTETYLTVLLSSYVHDDLQGSLDYLADMVGSLYEMKEALNTSFDYYAKESQNSYVNMLRVSNQDIRLFLDSRLSDVRSKKDRLLQNTRRLYNPNRYKQMGAQSFLETIHDSVASADATWKYVLTEHIGTSEMNIDQNETFFKYLSGKRKNQALYHYTDLVDREFDRDNKESELNRFISIHGLHKRR